MKTAFSFLLFALTFTCVCLGQDGAKPVSNKSSTQPVPTARVDTSPSDRQLVADPVTTGSRPTTFDTAAKFRYYIHETYLNPSAVTAPAFRAGIRMANPPGKGATKYPSEWRQGAEAFGRNYGDAIAERTTFQTARFATGLITHEDPRYIPSSSHNFLARSLHAFSFAFLDRSDSGGRMPAVSNFVGAAAAGFVGNAYLPSGFDDVTHAGQRAIIHFGTAAAGNLFREFAPQMPGPLRALFMLVGR